MPDPSVPEAVTLWVCPECGDSDLEPGRCNGPMGAGEHRPPIHRVKYVPTSPEPGLREALEEANDVLNAAFRRSHLIDHSACRRDYERREVA